MKDFFVNFSVEEIGRVGRRILCLNEKDEWRVVAK